MLEEYIEQLKHQKKRAFLNANKVLREYPSDTEGNKQFEIDYKKEEEKSDKAYLFISATKYSAIQYLYSFFERIQESCRRNKYKITSISDYQILESIEKDEEFSDMCYDFWNTDFDDEYFELYGYVEEVDKYRKLNPSSEEDTKYFLGVLKEYINKTINKIIAVRERNYLGGNEFDLPLSW